MRVPLAFACLLALLGGARADEAPVRFADALYQKFQHPRCLTCHQFNSRRSNGKSYGSHRSRYLCDKCHVQRLTGLEPGEWMAPPASKMDYTGLSPRDTCELIKHNVGAGDINARLLAHLLHDVRIRWALESGGTPMGRMPTVPGGYADWARDVESWARDGMLCE
ncbi:MAG: hypothetical protein AB1831_13355 [Pseudomonadota bacterium]